MFFLLCNSLESVNYHRFRQIGVITEKMRNSAAHNRSHKLDIFHPINLVNFMRGCMSEENDREMLFTDLKRKVNREHQREIIHMRLLPLKYKENLRLISKQPIKYVWNCGSNFQYCTFKTIEKLPAPIYLLLVWVGRWYHWCPLLVN